MWLRNVEKKKKFVLSSSLRIPDPYLVLKNLWPPSSQWPLDFLSTCLGIHSEIQSFICVRLFATLWTVARQAPLSMEFSRQQYWNR